ncbi:MAG: tRNA lysidine(34) synthetase TilS [Clostridia bacterium]|nr:tRNA lysidine(34) synthetase TilS [Clostridia bacterium]
MLFSAFKNEILNEKLFEKQAHVVAAVSGGADSVCLLHLLYRLRKEWGFTLSCAHVNHNLRPEAFDDAAFVESLCKEWNIPFFLHDANVQKIAKDNKISLELAGREVRYRFFMSLGADVILTAHNKNDAAESVLMHFIRGCGLDGLCGIQKKRKDGVCRPLLGFSREDIEAYLHKHKLIWHQDASNSDITYTRNNIRHNLLPQIMDINPSFLETIPRMTEILTEENQYMQTQAENFTVMHKERDATFFSVETLFSMPITLRRRAVRVEADSFADVNKILELLEKKNGSVHMLSNGKIAEREYGNIVVYRPDMELPSTVSLPEEGEVFFGKFRIIVGENGLALPRKKYTVRIRRNGDVFTPEGMQGHKKISDFFTDEKIPRRKRDVYPIIVCEGQIAAVGDMRRSGAFVPSSGENLHIKIEEI